MWYFSDACPRKNIGDIYKTKYCKCVCNIPEWMEEEFLFCVVLIFFLKLVFKLWTQSNDNLVAKFIFGKRLVMSEKVYFSSGRVKVCKRIFRTRGLHMTGDFILSLTLFQLRYQRWHLLYLKNAGIEPSTLSMLSTRSTNQANLSIWCVNMHL